MLCAASLLVEIGQVPAWPHCSNLRSVAAGGNGDDCAQLARRASVCDRVLPGRDFRRGAASSIHRRTLRPPPAPGHRADCSRRRHARLRRRPLLPRCQHHPLPDGDVPWTRQARSGVRSQCEQRCQPLHRCPGGSPAQALDHSGLLAELRRSLPDRLHDVAARVLSRFANPARPRRGVAFEGEARRKLHAVARDRHPLRGRSGIGAARPLHRAALPRVDYRRLRRQPVALLPDNPGTAGGDGALSHAGLRPRAQRRHHPGHAAGHGAKHDRHRGHRDRERPGRCRHPDHVPPGCCHLVPGSSERSRRRDLHLDRTVPRHLFADGDGAGLERSYPDVGRAAGFPSQSRDPDCKPGHADPRNCLPGAGDDRSHRIRVRFGARERRPSLQDHACRRRQRLQLPPDS